MAGIVAAGTANANAANAATIQRAFNFFNK
jgi:hypothetical protein